MSIFFYEFHVRNIFYCFWGYYYFFYYLKNPLNLSTQRIIDYLYDVQVPYTNLPFDLTILLTRILVAFLFNFFDVAVVFIFFTFLFKVYWMWYPATLLSLLYDTSLYFFFFVTLKFFIFAGLIVVAFFHLAITVIFPVCFVLTFVTLIPLDVYQPRMCNRLQ
jgi:hypothetical protein